MKKKVNNKKYKPEKIHIASSDLERIVGSLNETGKAKVHRLGEFRITKSKAKSNLSNSIGEVLDRLRIGFKPSTRFKSNFKGK